MTFIDELGRLVAGRDWIFVAALVLAAWAAAAAIIFVRNAAFRFAVCFVATMAFLFAGVVTLSDVHGILADDATTAVLGIVAVVSGWIGAQVALQSLDRTALDTAANAFLDLRARYHSDDMSSAIKLLADFAIPIKHESIEQWRRKLDSENYAALGKILVAHRERLSPTQQEELKRAVRRAAGYFDDVGFLFKHHILTRETTESFINLSGLNAYYEVCVPLYAVDNASAPSIAYARLLRTVLKQQGAGLVKRY